MKYRNELLSLCALALVLPGLAVADHDNGRRFERGKSVYARVVRVEPIIRYVTVRVPYEQCWDEPQRAYSNRDASGSGLVGAIIGGVIGNQFGSGRGRKVATVLGAVIGGSLAKDAALAKAERYGGNNGRDTYLVRRCETAYEIREEERVDGYNVTYRYKGDTYMTRLPKDPGSRIRLRVRITPIIDY